MEKSFLKNSLTLFKAMMDVNLSQLNDKLLLEYHRKCHMLYAGNIKRRPVNKPFINSVVSFHDKIVKEMEKRKFKHNSPLKKV